MLWRYLFEEHLRGQQFMERQLGFEQGVYRKMADCFGEERRGREKECAAGWEGKLEQYGIAVQWLIAQREKVGHDICRYWRGS
jgi:hypothetical protein